MSQQQWTLIDVKQGVFQEFFEFSELLKQHNENYKVPIHISKHRLHGGISDNVDVVNLNNGRISLEILPTRGMGIWKAQCGDVELKWDSPVLGPVHPSWVPIHDPNGLGWLEGFDEWLVRCGLESNGSPEFDTNGTLRYPLHGRIANLPAHHLSLSVNRETGEITLAGKIIESKLFFKKLELQSSLTTYAGSTKFVVRDTVTNLSAEPSEFELLYHINTGQPFALPGSRVVVPFERMAPRTETAVQNLSEWDKLGNETPGSEEVVFFFEPGADQNGYCKTLLINSHENRGLVLGFNRNSFPYFSFWKSRLANTDGYVCGLEPSVNFPNNRSFEKEQGRVVALKPGESRTFELYFEILCNTESVQKTEQEIRNFKTANVIEPKPKKEWTP
ncbi:MAG: aldose 1-epimerase family protein [Planctomycetaceae bacterium]|jgi:galactose mutarotase-like enzyme|nr:aldose 1-epimerase family protein [Planctomycetaceae bacterium]